MLCDCIHWHEIRLNLFNGYAKSVNPIGFGRYYDVQLSSHGCVDFVYHEIYAKSFCYIL